MLTIMAGFGSDGIVETGNEEPSVGSGNYQ